MSFTGTKYIDKYDKGDFVLWKHHGSEFLAMVTSNKEDRYPAIIIVRVLKRAASIYGIPYDIGNHPIFINGHIANASLVDLEITFGDYKLK